MIVAVALRDGEEVGASDGGASVGEIGFPEGRGEGNSVGVRVGWSICTKKVGRFDGLRDTKISKRI